jgi:hypothetical protein
MPLLAWCLLILFQHTVDEHHHLGDQPCWLALDFLAFGWDRVTDGFAHHPPVHAQFPGYTLDCPDAFLVLAPDRLE